MKRGQHSFNIYSVKSSVSAAFGLNSESEYVMSCSVICNILILLLHSLV